MLATELEHRICNVVRECVHTRFHWKLHLCRSFSSMEPACGRTPWQSETTARCAHSKLSPSSPCTSHTSFYQYAQLQMHRINNIVMGMKYVDLDRDADSYLNGIPMRLKWRSHNISRKPESPHLSPHLSSTLLDGGTNIWLTPKPWSTKRGLPTLVVTLTSDEFSPLRFPAIEALEKFVRAQGFNRPMVRTDLLLYLLIPTLFCFLLSTHHVNNVSSFPGVVARLPHGVRATPLACPKLLEATHSGYPLHFRTSH